MADTLDNIELAANTWVNIYTHPVIVAAGIAVGTQLTVQNIGETTLRVHAGATPPTGTSGFREIAPGALFNNDTGDAGAFILSPVIDGLTNIRSV